MPKTYKSALIRATAIAVAASCIISTADARAARSGGSGGNRASAGTANRSGGARHSGTATRNGGAHATANRSGNVNRNANVNNVNVNRNVNVNGNGGAYGRGYAGGYHPVARAATVGAMAVTTGAIIGSAYHTLPSNCATVVRPMGTYHHCGSAWYQSQGGEYIVVQEP